MERIEDAVSAVNASYTPCLNPHVVIVDRHALDELLAAIGTLQPCPHPSSIREY